MNFTITIENSKTNKTEDFYLDEFFELQDLVELVMEELETEDENDLILVEIDVPEFIKRLLLINTEKEKVTEALQEDIFEIINEAIDTGFDEEVFDAFIEIDYTNEPFKFMEAINEAYYGEFESDEEFAEQFYEELGEINHMGHLANYIDWEAVAYDLMFDYTEEDGHYFRNI